MHQPTVTIIHNNLFDSMKTLQFFSFVESEVTVFIVLIFNLADCMKTYGREEAMKSVMGSTN